MTAGGCGRVMHSICAAQQAARGSMDRGRLRPRDARRGATKASLQSGEARPALHKHPALYLSPVSPPLGLWTAGMHTGREPAV